MGLKRQSVVLFILLVITMLELSGCAGGKGSVKVTWSEFNEYRERRVYLFERLTEIKQEVYDEFGEETFQKMIDSYNSHIKNAKNEVAVDFLERSKQEFVDYNPKDKVDFYSQKSLGLGYIGVSNERGYSCAGPKVGKAGAWLVFYNRRSIHQEAD